jgi:hypothetical protein
LRHFANTCTDSPTAAMPRELTYSDVTRCANALNRCRDICGEVSVPMIV